VTFAYAVAVHVEPVDAVCHPAWSRRRSLAVQHSEPVTQQHGRFAPRRNDSASTATTARRTIGIDVVVQQYALH
jgi:hypothetical protein